MTTRPKRRSVFCRTTRCPVCHAAGCLVAGPRKTPVAAVCRRTTSAKVIGARGWLHLLDRRGPVFAWTPAGREVTKMAREASG